MVTALTYAATVGSATIGGLFFAYSTFTMQGIRHASPEHGIASMQAINLAAPKDAVFLTVWLGTAAIAVALAIRAITDLGRAGSVHHIVGAAIYIVTIVLTAVYHIPRNDALAKLDPRSAEAARYWARYVVEWTRWNHVRTLAGVGAGLAFALSLRAEA